MNFKSKLRSVVEDNTTKKGKIFDYIIDLLIVFFWGGYVYRPGPSFIKKHIF